MIPMPRADEPLSTGVVVCPICKTEQMYPARLRVAVSLRTDLTSVFAPPDCETPDWFWSFAILGIWVSVSIPHYRRVECLSNEVCLPFYQKRNKVLA